MSRPRRLMAWVARAATPIATIARSAVGSGRTADRNCSARARSTTRRTAWPRWVRRSVRWRRSSGSCVPLDEPPPDEAVDQPARRRRRAADRLGQLADRQRAAVGQDVQRRELGEPEAQLPELAGKADDQLAPQRPAHRHALADLADVREPVAGRQDGRRQVRLEPPGDRPGRRRAASMAACAGRSSDTLASVRRDTERMQPCMVVARGDGSSRLPCARMQSACLRVPRPGLAVGRDGPRPRRRLARRRRRLRRRRRGPRRTDQRARLGRPGRAPRPDRERPAGAPGHLDRDPRGAPRALGAPRASRRPTPAFAAGHSMGQYSALVAAGALVARRRRPARPRARPADAGVRARAATARWPRSSASTTRDSPSWSTAASQHGVFVVANRNAPGQVVVSGERPAIEAGAELARALGAKRAIVLPVSVAAHSPLMAEAADGMRAALAGVDVPRPGGPAPGQRRRPPDRDGRGLPRPSSSST